MNAAEALPATPPLFSLALRAGVPGSVGTLAASRRHVLSRLPAPTPVTFGTALPRTPNGKARRALPRQEPPS